MKTQESARSRSADSRSLFFGPAVPICGAWRTICICHPESWIRRNTIQRTFLAEHFRQDGMELREISYRAGHPGVVPTIVLSTGRPSIGLRADMDALPDQASEGVYSSPLNSPRRDPCLRPHLRGICTDVVSRRPNI